jgi:lipoprotein signal peptidase
MNLNKNNLYLIFAAIILDQISKYLARLKIIAFGKIVENPGLPFGIITPGFFSLAVTAAALILFVFFYSKYFTKQGLDFGYSLIVGGALSNIIDRLPDGRVADFINIGVSTMNVADVLIVAGIVILLFNSRITKHESSITDS